jgi:hypothetical protein
VPQDAKAAVAAAGAEHRGDIRIAPRSPQVVGPRAVVAGQVAQHRMAVGQVLATDHVEAPRLQPRDALVQQLR